MPRLYMKRVSDALHPLSRMHRDDNKLLPNRQARHEQVKTLKLYFSKTGIYLLKYYNF